MAKPKTAGQNTSEYGLIRIVVIGVLALAAVAIVAPLATGGSVEDVVRLLKGLGDVGTAVGVPAAGYAVSRGLAKREPTKEGAS